MYMYELLRENAAEKGIAILCDLSPLCVGLNYELGEFLKGRNWFIVHVKTVEKSVERLWAVSAG